MINAELRGDGYDFEKNKKWVSSPFFQQPCPHCFLMGGPEWIIPLALLTYAEAGHAKNVYCFHCLVAEANEESLIDPK